MDNPVRRLLDGPSAYGSTRALGLFRIALCAMVFMRYSKSLSLYQAEDILHMALGSAFFVFASLALIGLFTRLALFGVFGVLFTMYFGAEFGVDHISRRSHHEYVLIVTSALLAMSPSGASFSVDRFLAVQRADRAGRMPLEERGPLWTQELLVLQLAAIYFWTAIDKSNASFLTGFRLERIMEAVYAHSPLLPWFNARPFAAAGSVAVVALEYALPIAILCRWRLPWAIAAAMLLHAGFYVMLPVSVYSATMMAFYILVVHPDRVHKWIDDLVRPPRPSTAA
ncbi:MAG: HTTM domain-containing protein [Pseudomonadota bacterium]